MKNYRVYAQIERGYEKIGEYNSIPKMLEKVDDLVEISHRILVIEHDFDLDMDVVAFMYYGDIVEYINIRNKYNGGNYYEICKKNGRTDRHK